MKSKRIIGIAIWLLSAVSPVMAQVSTDHFREDGSRYVCSQQEVMYDDFFHAARFAVVAVADAYGLVTFSLEVTFDEGMLHVSRGDSLSLVLRGGDCIVLKADRDVTQSDILKRHFKSHNNYYVTCHFAMSAYDIQRITRNRATKLSMQTDDFTFDRKLNGFQDRFRRQFTAVYRYLIGS